MTLLSVACAVGAVLLLLAPGGGKRLERRLADASAAATVGTRSLASWPLLIGINVLALLVVGVSLGMRACVVLATAAEVVLVVGRLVQLRRRRRVAARARTQVAHACRVLAGQLRVGRIPLDALVTAATDCPVLAAAAAGVAVGADPTRLWRVASLRPGHRGLAVLAQAWRVSSESGAPLAPALERVAEALTADLAVQRLVAGEVAAARATGKVMAALPLCGVAIGYAIGGRPLQFLLAGPAGWLCLVAGVALALGGVSWIEWLARRATEQE